MAEKNEANWWQNYQALKAFVAEHQHLPNKKKIENRRSSLGRYELV